MSKDVLIGWMELDLGGLANNDRLKDSFTLQPPDTAPYTPLGAIPLIRSNGASTPVTAVAPAASGKLKRENSASLSSAQGANAYHGSVSLEVRGCPALAAAMLGGRLLRLEGPSLSLVPAAWKIQAAAAPPGGAGSGSGSGASASTRGGGGAGAGAGAGAGGGKAGTPTGTPQRGAGAARNSARSPTPNRPISAASHAGSNGSGGGSGGGGGATGADSEPVEEYLAPLHIPIAEAHGLAQLDEKLENNPYRYLLKLHIPFDGSDPSATIAFPLGVGVLRLDYPERPASAELAAIRASAAPALSTTQPSKKDGAGTASGGRNASSASSSKGEAPAGSASPGNGSDTPLLAMTIAHWKVKWHDLRCYLPKPMVEALANSVAVGVPLLLTLHRYRVEPVAGYLSASTSNKSDSKTEELECLPPFFDPYSGLPPGLRFLEEDVLYRTKLHLSADRLTVPGVSSLVSEIGVVAQVPTPEDIELEVEARAAADAAWHSMLQSYFQKAPAKGKAGAGGASAAAGNARAKAGTTGAAAKTGTAEKKKKGAAAAPTEPEEVLDVHSHPYTKAGSIFHCGVHLHAPIHPVLPGMAGFPKDSTSLVPPRRLLPAAPSDIDAETEFRTVVAQAIAVIAAQYAELVVRAAENFSAPLGSEVQQRQALMELLRTSGVYEALRRSLRQAATRLSEERLKGLPGNGCAPGSHGRDVFIGHLYAYMLSHMHAALNQAIQEARLSVPVPLAPFATLTKPTAAALPSTVPGSSMPWSKTTPALVSTLAAGTGKGLSTVNGDTAHATNLLNTILGEDATLSGGGANHTTVAGKLSPAVSTPGAQGYVGALESPLHRLLRIALECEFGAKYDRAHRTHQARVLVAEQALAQCSARAAYPGGTSPAGSDHGSVSPGSVGGKTPDMTQASLEISNVWTDYGLFCLRRISPAPNTASEDGFWVRAATCFREAIAATPHHVPALMALAAVQATAGNHDEAVIFSTSAVNYLIAEAGKESQRLEKLMEGIGLRKGELGGHTLQELRKFQEDQQQLQEHTGLVLSNIKNALPLAYALQSLALQRKGQHTAAGTALHAGIVSLNDLYINLNATESDAARCATSGALYLILSRFLLSLPLPTLARLSLEQAQSALTDSEAPRSQLADLAILKVQRYLLSMQALTAIPHKEFADTKKKERTMEEEDTPNSHSDRSDTSPFSIAPPAEGVISQLRGVGYDSAVVNAHEARNVLEHACEMSASLSWETWYLTASLWISGLVNARRHRSIAGAEKPLRGGYSELGDLDLADLQKARRTMELALGTFTPPLASGYEAILTRQLCYLSPDLPLPRASPPLYSTEDSHPPPSPSFADGQNGTGTGGFVPVRSDSIFTSSSGIGGGMIFQDKYICTRLYTLLAQLQLQIATLESEEDSSLHLAAANDSYCRAITLGSGIIHQAPPAWASVWFGIARTKWAQADAVAAEAALNEANALDNGNPAVWGWLAYLCMATAPMRERQANSALEQALKTVRQLGSTIFVLCSGIVYYSLCTLFCPILLDFPHCPSPHLFVFFS